MATLNINPDKAPIVTEWPGDIGTLDSISSCLDKDNLRLTALETLALILLGTDRPRLANNHKKLMLDSLRVLTLDVIESIQERV
jgi:hypothetical protein